MSSDKVVNRLVTELLRKYPHDFTNNYEDNREKLRNGDYLDVPRHQIRNQFGRPDVSNRPYGRTLHMVAGKLASTISEYESKCRDWRQQMAANGHVVSDVHNSDIGGSHISGFKRRKERKVYTVRRRR